MISINQSILESFTHRLCLVVKTYIYVCALSEDVKASLNVGGQYADEHGLGEKKGLIKIVDDTR